MNTITKKQPLVIAGAIGECVHVAGITRFLHLARQAGWRTVFLGPAVTVERFLQAIQENNPDMVGVSYRLTPETGERLLAGFAEAADDLHTGGLKFVFGGTPPVAERARKLGFFEQVFDGHDRSEDLLAFLHGHDPQADSEQRYPQSTIERIHWKAPYPLLRHHFGLPTMAATLAGIAEIASAKTLDVLSLGIDQDAQANFFHPERQNPHAHGAGGVPVRSPEDYQRLYAASRRGNFPLLRTYSGTDDFLRLAEMYMQTIHIAWSAIPLFWFNQMDGRGPWDLQGSIEQHQEVMRFYAEKQIPVEVNEPHHWGMRDAPDVLFVVAAYLSAYNARACGVQDYIAQLMFNSPAGTSDRMDLAKMLACLEIIEPLERPNFHIWRQTRTGLLSYPLNMDEARGHLAASIYLQMAIKPHIIHVVGHTEAQHAATAADIITATAIARRTIDNAIQGQPDMLQDTILQERKSELIHAARTTLAAIQDLAQDPVSDPLVDAHILTRAVTTGILDAPQLLNNPYAKGAIATSIDTRGACISINPLTRAQWSERERLQSLLKDH